MVSYAGVEESRSVRDTASMKRSGGYEYSQGATVKVYVTSYGDINMSHAIKGLSKSDAL